MKKVTITHEAEVTFIDDFDESEIDYMMQNQEGYVKLLESRMKEVLECDDFHIKDLKLFIHDGEV